MDKLEKINFVDALCEAIAKEIIADIGKGKIPENWDGIELRWLIAERAQQCAKFGDKRRKAAFNNTIIVNNL